MSLSGLSNEMFPKPRPPQPALALTGQYSGVAFAVGLGAMAADGVLVFGARRRKATG